MPSYETGDVLRDLDAVRGLTFTHAFSLVPLDLTGCSAVMVVDTIGTLTMAVQPSTLGAFALGGLSYVASAATTAAWPAGLYAYRVRVTFADGSVWPMGHGKLHVK